MSFLRHYKLTKKKSLTIIPDSRVNQSCKDERNYYTILLMVLESKTLLHANLTT